jgi:hypothetical protein
MIIVGGYQPNPARRPRLRLRDDERFKAHVVNTLTMYQLPARWPGRTPCGQSDAARILQLETASQAEMSRVRGGSRGHFA